MKTSKTNSESENIMKVIDSVKNNKSIGSNSRPTEEDIREKANEIYLRRLEYGEGGTAENDWIEAEKYLSDLKD